MLSPSGHRRQDITKIDLCRIGGRVTGPPPRLLTRQARSPTCISSTSGLENERLHAEALGQLAELRSSGARIVAAGDDRAATPKRDLHDGAQQRLVGLSLGLRLLEANAARDVYESS
jgi:hypothetical protein